MTVKSEAKVECSERVERLDRVDILNYLSEIRVCSRDCSVGDVRTCLSDH